MLLWISTTWRRNEELYSARKMTRMIKSLSIIDIIIDYRSIIDIIINYRSLIIYSRAIL